MDTYQFPSIAGEIHVLLGMVMKLSARAAEQYFADHQIDINLLQFGVLRTLRQHHFTLSELSKLFSVDPSTLVPVVDALERKGLVERGRDPDDRRRIPLHLTAEGAALLQRISSAHGGGILEKSLHQLGERKTAQLRELLRELVYTMPEGERTFCQMQDHLRMCQPPPQPVDGEIV